MSNRLNIESNCFGFTVSDDYDCQFVPYKGADEIDNPVEVIRLCREGLHSGHVDLIDFLEENQKGAYINDEWHDFEEIEEAFKERK